MRWAALIIVMAQVSAGCSHVPPAPERRIYVVAESADGVGSAPGVGGSGFRNCEDEQIECWDDCWKKKPPYPMKKKDPGHYEYCTRTCREAYTRCVQENEEKARELAREAKGREFKFSRVDKAIEWIGEHKTEIAIGTVVVVAGVLFVLAVGPGGALILVPLL
jgi:hypothetical protein